MLGNIANTWWLQSRGVVSTGTTTVAAGDANGNSGVGLDDQVPVEAKIGCNSSQARRGGCTLGDAATAALSNLSPTGLCADVIHREILRCVEVIFRIILKCVEGFCREILRYI